MAPEFAALRDDPFALLRAMDTRLRATHADLAARGTAVWTGIAVRLGERWVVVPRAEVREILPRPALTRVPGAKAFLLGIANLRGALLPVSDLGFLSGGKPAGIDRDQRIVVLNSRHIPAGFLVDAVGGYQRFSPEDQRHGLAGETGLPTPWLLGAFVHEARIWPVLSLQRVARSEEFTHAGA